MTNVILSIFFIVLSSYSQNYVDIEQIKGNNVEFTFSTYEKQYSSEFGEMIIIIRSDKNIDVKKVYYTPEPREGDIDFETTLPKGKYKIVFYDKNNKVLAVSKQFEIR